MRANLPAAALAVAALGGCAAQPLMPYTADTPPLVLVPAAQAGVQDKRARFREIFCAVLEARKERASRLSPVRRRAHARGRRARRQRARQSPWSHRADASWLSWSRDSDTTASRPGSRHPALSLRTCAEQGYDLSLIRVEGLSSTTRNARLIRDALMSMPAEPDPPRIVLIGYSKGSNDILEALVTYPELRPRVAAFVSIAGSIGGSPLANDAEQDQADLLRHFPGATCGSGDGGAVASLRPGVRASSGSPRTRCPKSCITTPSPRSRSRNESHRC